MSVLEQFSVCHSLHRIQIPVIAIGSRIILDCLVEDAKDIPGLWLVISVDVVKVTIIIRIICKATKRLIKKLLIFHHPQDLFMEKDQIENC